MACSWTRRAALVPTPGAKVYGLVFSLTRSELDRLYSESSVQAYKPQAVLAQLASGGVAAALCYNVPQPPSPTERNPEYAVPDLHVQLASKTPCFGGGFRGPTNRKGN